MDAGGTGCGLTKVEVRGRRSSGERIHLFLIGRNGIRNLILLLQ